jgi:hypothetical protein
MGAFLFLKGGTMMITYHIEVGLSSPCFFAKRFEGNLIFAWANGPDKTFGM